MRKWSEIFFFLSFIFLLFLTISKVFETEVIELRNVLSKSAAKIQLQKMTILYYIVERLSEEKEETKKLYEENTVLLKSALKKIQGLEKELAKTGKKVESDIEIMRDRAQEYLHKVYVLQGMQNIDDRIEIEGDFQDQKRFFLSFNFQRQSRSSKRNVSRVLRLTVISKNPNSAEILMIMTFHEMVTNREN